MQLSYRLYHYPICPFSRIIRFVLYDLKIDFVPVIENFWEKREKFMNINPTGDIPFLAIKREEKKPLLIYGHTVILQYLFDSHGSDAFLSKDLDENMKILTLSHWVNHKFYNEATKFILNERIYSWYQTKRGADSQLLKLARINLNQHLKFLTHKLGSYDWIAYNKCSLADITLACHISSLDYLGEINWEEYRKLQEWYSVIKSKPAFRDMLYDTIPGFKATSWYRELDF